MRFLKLLTIPAVLLLSVALAVPAFAHELHQVTLTEACNQTSGRICLTLNANIDVGNDERIVEFDIYGNGSNASLGKVTFDLPANQPANGQEGQPLPFKDTQCFPPITTGNFTSFTIKLVSVTDSKGKAADLDFTASVVANDKTTHVDFDNDAPRTFVENVGVCLAPSPSPSPSASPATTVALASTGGFDLRFPLIGLVVLVAGGALFLVSASRGRTGTR